MSNIKQCHLGSWERNEEKIDEILKNHKKVTKSFSLPCEGFVNIFGWIKFTKKSRKGIFYQIIHK